jgi:hypothetical protein
MAAQSNQLAGRIALPGMRDAGHYTQTDQNQDADADPLGRNVRQMRSDGQSGDEHDETDDVQCKGHTSSNVATRFPAPVKLLVQLEGQF